MMIHKVVVVAAHLLLLHLLLSPLLLFYVYMTVETILAYYRHLVVDINTCNSLIFRF